MEYFHCCLNLREVAQPHFAWSARTAACTQWVAELDGASVFIELLWNYWLHCEVLLQWARGLVTFPTQCFGHQGFSLFMVLQDCCEWKRIELSVDWVFFSSELCAVLLCLCVGLEEGFMFLKCFTGGPFHSGAVCLEVASISKLRLNDLVVGDSYIKWSVELNPDFFF